MPLTLTIENETTLPDGGPLSVSVSGKRGLDIGRDQHLDWTLPDPSRFISGKHCEIRYRDGAYWLHDVSTNGTFLNGAEGRLKGPHRLRNGDRLGIGHYIIVVTVDGEEAAAAQSLPPQPAAYHELWKSAEDAAPPIDPAQLRPPQERAPVHPDFLDWAADVPNSVSRSPAPEAWPSPAPSAPAGPWQTTAPAPTPPAAPSWPEPPPQPPPDTSFDWAHGAERQAPAPEPVPPTPTPQRPAVWVSNEPAGPWSGAGSAPLPEPVPPASSAPAAAAPQPPPAPADPPSPPPNVAPPSPPAGTDAEAFISQFARAAGVPEQLFAGQDPSQLGERFGQMMQIVVENLRQLLQARLQAKRLARTSNQTMVQAIDNNPLKFSPTTKDALRIMFGSPTHSYLDAQRTLEQSFHDVKSHQIKTYAAMQQAMRMLLADLDPQSIDQSTERGLPGVGSRKAKLWDTYQARWQSKTAHHEGGMLDVFMLYFAECYDRSSNDLR